MEKMERVLYMLYIHICYYLSNLVKYRPAGMGEMMLHSSPTVTLEDWNRDVLVIARREYFVS